MESKEEGVNKTQESLEYETTCEKTRPPVVIPWKTLLEITFWNLGPTIQKAMKRKEQKLPASASALIHPKLHLTVFGSLDKVVLSTQEEIQDVLGPWAIRRFQLDAYAKLTPPITIQHRKGKTRVLINYAVYNHEDVLQWPETYIYD